jgi:cytochrome P450 family 12
LEKTLKIDKKLAVVTCIDSLLAGVDTTSAAFLSILYCLAKNPEKQQTLRDEIMTIIPNKTDKLTVENMKNLPYLRAVIKEGLRLYSPASGTIRRTERDLVLNGYQVPKGQEVMLLTLKSGQKEENFQRSKEFIPERFLKDNNDPQCPHAKTSHPFSYIPFGFGRLKI